MVGPATRAISHVRRQVYGLITCVAVIAIAAVMADMIEHNFGKVDIQTVAIKDPSGAILAGKIYRPEEASATNKMPAVLNLHGYQNDKDVNAPFSIELARRGFVVLALDAIGHGDSGGSVDTSLIFADPSYTVGTNTGYVYLKTLSYVDATRIGVMGHSMGAINAMFIALANPDHRALDFVAGTAGMPNLHNLLLTQARYDEFTAFRENLPRTEDLTSNPARIQAFGLTEPYQWDTTYGSFADGTARRAAYVNMEHHLLPMTNKAVAEAVDWMRLALKDGQTDKYWIEPTNQVFMWKEVFGLVTLVVTMVSLIPLTNLLLATTYFAPVAQPMPKRYVPSTRTWWIFATVNALIGGLLYPWLTSMAGLDDKVQALIPWARMPMGNGLFLWYLVNAIVCGVLFFVWYRTSARKAGVTMHDMGVSFDENKTRLDWGILGKTLLLGVVLFAWMYVLEAIFQWTLGQEFRFTWPFMRQFSSLGRVGYFVWYLLPALAFFLINGGVFLFGQARQPEQSTAARTQWLWWLKNVYAGLFGLALVWAFQYVPWFFFGSGPGFEAVGLPQFSQMWPLMLFVYIPLFAVLLFFLTWFYRRTGRIYLGALMISSLAIWFLTAGTLIVK
jgi:pimeloyl-ACP methyl ester carboxylesterase